MQEGKAMEMNHVLVVEDDKEIREGVKIYLKSQGDEVYEAADGIEGLKVLEKEEIHLAIVDIMMPRMDGIELIRHIKENVNTCDIPVISLLLSFLQNRLLRIVFNVYN